MKFILLVTFLINFCVIGMEVEQHIILPLDVLGHICKSPKDRSKTSYTMNLPEVNAFPWSISPCLVKATTMGQPIPDDLCNPLPHSKVLPNVQFWKNNRGYRLSEDLRGTDDHFNVNVGNIGVSTYLFDGINMLGTMVLCHKHDSDGEAFYKIYTLEQTVTPQKDTDHNEIQQIMTNVGLLSSLMLENERNRIMYTVFSCFDEGNELCKRNELYIDDIDPKDKKVVSIANCITADLFIKTVCLGKDTYLGITDKGDLYSIWLENGAIKLAKQHFAQPKEFLHISVDNSVITEKGFHPKVAFLTKSGDIFVTHLTFCDHPTLFHAVAIENATTVKRLYYRDGKLYIIYQAEDAIYEYKDNLHDIALLYLYTLLKKHFVLQ